MAGSEDLISFEVIESQKENIQSLPGGRSARKLAQLYSPSSSSASPGGKLVPILTPTPNPSETKTLHETIRADFEAELASVAESDDPLDVYDRYVRWTLDAYPSAQATPQSQLHVLLERATKAFVGSAQYRNDPRYLRIWLHYIRLFSDAPREAYVYLARHGIGESLALFYEEYAAWLESAGRWAQADEVLRLGLERGARPQPRLVRKYGEFEQRRAAQAPESLDPGAGGPSSPALPTVRPALAAKVDPFASAAAAAAAARDPQQAQRQQQQQQQQQQAASQSGRSSAKPKMSIFSDADAAAQAPALPSGSGSSSAKGWESIGSLAERKKENVVAAKPWVGEKLSAGGKKTTTKLAVFKDASLAKSHITIHPSQYQVTVNAQSGKKERVFVDLRAVYPTPEEPGTELSFEEIWVGNRGLRHAIWEERADERAGEPVDLLADEMPSKLVVHHDMVMLDENGAMIKPQGYGGRPKKKKVMEINETQIIKAKLDSPSGGKLKKRGSISEPTMTMHTRAATDDIYEIFNQPRPAAPLEEEDADAASDDDYETDGDYTSGAESTGTTRALATSEAGDEEEEEEGEGESAWAEGRAETPPPGMDAADDDSLADEALSPLSVHGLHVTGDATPELPSSPAAAAAPKTRTVFIPIPPEDYVAPTRPYRDPAEVANNRLPFMTPITERTESSLEFDSEDNRRALHAKTPSKPSGLAVNEAYEEEEEEEEEEGSEAVSGEPMSSPLLEVVKSPLLEVKSPLLEVEEELAPPAAKLSQPVFRPKTTALGPKAPRAAPVKGPIIHETQCNPLDESIRAEILGKMQPPLQSYPGFYDRRGEKCDKAGEIRRYAKAQVKLKASGGSGSGGSASERSSDAGLSVAIQFAGCRSRYSVQRELGAGAFAPVFLVENATAGEGEENGENDKENDENGSSHMGRGAFASAYTKRHGLEALKMETPATAWEFAMMRLAHGRLGAQDRATASLAPALECHLCRDESFLFLPYYPHGTLLDVVNLFRGEASGVMDEALAMFFAVELLRTVEALHGKQMLHGDIKADNCLLRLDEGGAGHVTGPWRAGGGDGWAARGVTLIDFGRAVDMRAFPADVRFVADWKTTAADCAEMREGRPWTWQPDYHGLAGVVHCLLFGKYMETVREAGGLGLGQQRRYRIRESLKRYWQTDIWAAAFDLLLNPAAHAAAEDGGQLPVLRGLRDVRSRMETWLAANGERGVGLRSLMGKVEVWARSRR